MSCDRVNFGKLFEMFLLGLFIRLILEACSMHQSRVSGKAFVYNETAFEMEELDLIDKSIYIYGQKVENQQGPELQRWPRRRAAVHGTAGPSSDGKYLGAPSTRGLFLYRVAKQVNKEDITAWMGSKNINCIHIEKTSNRDDMFQSFKITVPADDYRESLDPECCPNGVYVRDFRMPMGGLRREKNNNGFS